MKTKQKPLTLSIVIPVYSEENYLSICLESIAVQTEFPDEVIVVDNNSTDNTRRIARSYNFVTLLTENTQGIAHARNAGFNQAKSDLIARIDADTILEPDWVAKAKKYLNKSPNVEAVSGMCDFYDIPLPQLAQSIHEFFYYKAQSWLAGTKILWGSNMLIRKSTWQRVRHLCNLTPGLYEDIDMSLKLRKINAQISQNPDLRASASLRRGDCGALAAMKYLSSWYRPYFLSGMFFRGSAIILLQTLVTLIVFLPCLIFTIYKKSVLLATGKLVQEIE